MPCCDQLGSAQFVCMAQRQGNELTGLTHADLQSRNIIFMLLEPNCSTITACLPCYGPLFRGGRSQVSLVRSVRSLFSLHSRRSRSTISVVGTQHSPPDSQIELKGHEGQSTIVAEHSSRVSDVEAGHAPMGAINKKSEVYVVRG